MLIAPNAPIATEPTLATQSETRVSDVEISRRVLEIRSNWTLGERIRRRRQAEQRFADLLTALNLDDEEFGCEENEAA